MITVFAQTNPFRPMDPQYDAVKSVRLPVATANTGLLLRAASYCVDALWRDGYRYKKAGVELHDLAPGEVVQTDLWSKPDSGRALALMKTIDKLNRDHVRGTVTFATSGLAREWRLRSERKSKHFTTDFEQLLIVAEAGSTKPSRD